MKKLVVAGGGLAGKTLIDELQKHNAELKITLIEPKDYLEVPYAQLRALVDPKGFSPGIRKNYSEMFKGVEHINDKLKSVGEKSIELESGLNIDFDFIVLATGSSFKSWSYLKGEEKSIKERQNAVERENAKLEKAESITIIGGGPIGVELAGEIAHSYPGKKVTLTHGPSRILGPVYSEKMTKRAVQILSKMGVEILTDSYYKQSSDGSWQDGNGATVQADLVIPAVGIDINSQWAKDSKGIKTNEKGAVKVDSTLRVHGLKNAFALGDLNDVPELKLGAFAGPQAKLTASNLMKLLKDENAVLKDYKPAAVLGLITIGPQKAAVQLPFGHPHFLGALKQKDLFVSKYLY